MKGNAGRDQVYASPSAEQAWQPARTNGLRLSAPPGSDITLFHGSSCANNGKDALNTPIFPSPFLNPCPVPHFHPLLSPLAPLASHARLEYILTTDQSDAGVAGIFSRRTNPPRTGSVYRSSRNAPWCPGGAARPTGGRPWRLWRSPLSSTRRSPSRASRPSEESTALPATKKNDVSSALEGAERVRREGKVNLDGGRRVNLDSKGVVWSSEDAESGPQHRLQTANQ
eukprot:5360229-Pyramimonas_sp.AAC.1